MLVVIAAAGCLVLGWWQWSRFESVGGTGQNLGYALQWPLFAAFVVYAYRRFVQLERDGGDERAAGPGEPTEIPAGLLPARPSVAPIESDPVMDEYNRYLAELNRSTAEPNHGAEPNRGAESNRDTADRRTP